MTEYSKYVTFIHTYCGTTLGVLRVNTRMLSPYFLQFMYAIMHAGLQSIISVVWVPDPNQPQHRSHLVSRYWKRSALGLVWVWDPDYYQWCTSQHCMVHAVSSQYLLAVFAYYIISNQILAVHGNGLGTRLLGL